MPSTNRPASVRRLSGPAARGPRDRPREPYLFFPTARRRLPVVAETLTGPQTHSPRTQTEDIGDDIATYNVLTKKTGPLNVTWNGVAMLQVPKGKTDKESNAIAKTVLIQRKEIVLQEVDRLYPKMKGQPKDYVIQMFEDPFADPVDMTQVAPNDVETAPAEFKFLEKGRRYPY